MQVGPTEDGILHIKPRELGKGYRQEDRRIQKELTEARTIHTEPGELSKGIRHEETTTQKELSEPRHEGRSIQEGLTEARTIHTEPGEVNKGTRHEKRTTQKESSEPCQTVKPDDTTSKYQTLVPLGCYFTGVPDVKGIVVTEIDNKRQTRTQVIEKRVVVYGMGLQVFDVTVGRGER